MNGRWAVATLASPGLTLGFSKKAVGAPANTAVWREAGLARKEAEKTDAVYVLHRTEWQRFANQTSGTQEGWRQGCWGLRGWPASSALNRPSWVALPTST